MTKSQLVTILAEEANITRLKAEVVVNTLFESISDALVKGGRVEIRGFGSFVNREYDAYKGRNPRTGAVIDVKQKKVPFFKAGKELKEYINA